MGGLGTVAVEGTLFAAVLSEAGIDRFTSTVWTACVTGPTSFPSRSRCAPLLQPLIRPIPLMSASGARCSNLLSRLSNGSSHLRLMRWRETVAGALFEEIRAKFDEFANESRLLLC